MSDMGLINPSIRWLDECHELVTNPNGRGGDGVCPELRLKGRRKPTLCGFITPRPPVERKGQVEVSLPVKTMKTLLIFPLLLLCNNSFAAESSSSVNEVSISQQARIPGKISDGRLAPVKPKVQQALSKYNIRSTQTNIVNGQKFIINEIEPPVIPPKKELTVEEIAKRDREFQEQLKTMKSFGGTFMVFAEIYNNKTTLLTFNHEGERYKVWSNLDWNLLCGFANFEGRGRRYGLFLLPLNTSIEGIKRDIEKGYKLILPTIPELPDLKTKGPSYMVVVGDEKNDEAMEFLEAIHDLYAVEETRLKTAYEQRKVNWKIRAEKEAELRKNPPAKPDIIINFWERDVVKERREAEAAKALKATQKGGQR